MKTIKYFAVVLACIATSAMAQTAPNIETALKSKYPNAVIKKIKHEKTDYVASFKNNDKKCKAFFDLQGNWLRTDVAMKWKTLPPAVRAGLVKSKYSSWLIEDASRVETPAGTIYSVEVDNEYTLDGDSQPAFEKTCYVYFSPSGGFLKEEDL